MIVQGILLSAGIASYLSPGVSGYFGRFVASVVDRMFEFSVSVLESRADEAKQVIQQALEAGEHGFSEND